MKPTIKPAGRAQVAIAAAIALLLGGCSGDDDGQAAVDGPRGGGGGARITVGSTNFSEQMVLANLYADALRDAGYQVDTRLNLGSREVVMPALESGEIDLVPEYLGALLGYYDSASRVTGRGEVEQALGQALPAGLRLLAASPAEDANALAVTAQTARAHGLEKISDLGPVAGQMVIGGPPELRTRELGLPGYQRVYGLEFAEFRPLDAGGPLTRAALNAGDIDVARVFSSQGILAQEDWVLLVDDRQLEPAQNIVPVVREGALDARASAALDALSARLTTADLQALNRRVDIDHEDPARVARAWLDAQPASADQTD